MNELKSSQNPFNALILFFWSDVAQKFWFQRPHEWSYACWNLKWINLGALNYLRHRDPFIGLIYYFCSEFGREIPLDELLRAQNMRKLKWERMNQVELFTALASFHWSNVVLSKQFWQKKISSMGFCTYKTLKKTQMGKNESKWTL